jgi:hypothetical protein
MVIGGKPEASDWTAVRKTKVTNSRDNGGISDVMSADMRCFGASAGKATVTVEAGDSLGFVASGGIMHFGPCLFYMARVPETADINTWDAAGKVWFKAGSIGAVQNGGPLSGTESIWPAYRKLMPLWPPTLRLASDPFAPDKPQVNFKVPKNVPSGRYLVRVESIALHLAQKPGGAQLYVSCGQVNVTGGGDGTPGPLVAFPGAYKATDQGLLFANSPAPTSYTPPGPPVWEG